MEPEVLDEHTEWEAQRVAAAFEGLTWERRVLEQLLLLTGIGYRDLQVFVQVRSGEWERIEIISLLLKRNESCDHSPTVWRVRQNELTGDYDPTGTLNYYADPCYYPPPYCGYCNQLMAHGIYRLGVENEEVLNEINYPLSTHEKLELRLSLPREFWPQTWIEEEKGE